MKRKLVSSSILFKTMYSAKLSDATVHWIMPEERETEHMCILLDNCIYTGAPLVQLITVDSVVSDSATPWTEAHQAPGKNAGVDRHFHVQLMDHL